METRRARATGRWTWPVAAAWALVVLAAYYRQPLLDPLGVLGWLSADLRSAVLPSVAVTACALAAMLVPRRLTARRATRTGTGTPSPPPQSRPSVVLRLLISVTGLGLVVLLLSAWRGDWPLPYFSEALTRSARGVAGFVLVAGDACVLGLLALRVVPLRLSSWAERLSFGFAGGLAVVSYGLLGLALLGLYRPAVVNTLLIAIALAGAVAAARKMLDLPPLPSLSIPRRDRPWAAVVVLALALSLLGALAPETEYDALWYHLWLPKLWLQAGRAVDLRHDYIALYPLTFELVFGAALSTGGVVAAKLLHWLCLPLTALAAFELTRRFTAFASPWLAAAIFVTVPTVLWEATTAYVDLALAFYVTLGVYALCHYVESGRRGWLASTAAWLGVATSIKHLGLVVVALVAAGLTVSRLRRPGGAVRALAPALAVLVVALALAGPWYVRAWRASGNPFFPELYRVFGARPADRWDDAAERGLDAFKARFGLPRTPVTLAMLPVNLTMHGARFGGCLGPVFLMMLPALAVRRPRRRTTWWLAYVTVGYVGVWASPLGSFQLRFLVPIVPLLATLAALAFSRVDASPGWPRRTAAAVLALVLLLNLPPFIPLHEGDREAWSGWLTHVVRIVPLRVVLGRESEDSYLRQRVATYGAWRYLDTNAGRDARVLEAGGGDEFYASRARVSIDSIPARGMYERGERGARAASETLANLNVGYVLVEKGWVRRLEHDDLAMLSADFRERWLSLEYEDSGAIVYRVK